MFEFLEAFEKRMEFVAVVDSIVNRKNKNSEIEAWFEGEELDNLFFSLLVYIMEQSLGENDMCTIENMAGFLDDILPEYDRSLTYEQVLLLTEYMVKDILQNKGVVKNYGRMHYGNGMVEKPVRLISDKILEDGRIIYQLTDQGYDFLFRTKEVDRELDFKLEQFKLKQLLLRKNYKHALRQSQDLVSMLRQKKREIELFVERVRQNIHNIDRGEHERLLQQTYDLIDEEYEEMQELKKAVEKDEDRIQAEISESGTKDAAMSQALENLGMIRRNLSLVIAGQRNLMGSRFHMNDIYEETIRSSFLNSMVRRYDITKVLMEPMEQAGPEQIPNLWKLFRPLFLPRAVKQLNPELLYARQGQMKEDDEELTQEAILLEEDRSSEEKRRVGAMYDRLIERIFKFASEHEDGFTFSQFYEHVSQVTQRLAFYTEKKRIFLVMLRLYDYGKINISEWKKESRAESVAFNGEFDLGSCLHQLEYNHPDFFGIEELQFEKGGGRFQTVLKEEIEDEDGIVELVERTIVMDDIAVTARSHQPQDRNREDENA